MRAGFRTLGVTAALAAAPCLPRADVEVDLSFASPAFHDEGWRPQRTQSPVGAGLRWSRDAWPVGIEARVQHERTREQNTLPLPVGHVAVDMLLGTASAGVVKARRSGTLRPFGGGGVAAILYRRYLFDNDLGGGGRLRDGGAAPGAYASGGILWRLGAGIVLGLEARLFAGAPVTLTEITVDPGAGFRVEERERSSTYREIGVRVGWTRPRR